MNAELGARRPHFRTVSRFQVLEHVVHLSTKWILLTVVAVSIVVCYWALPSLENGTLVKSITEHPHTVFETILSSVEELSIQLTSNVDRMPGPTSSDAIVVVETSTAVEYSQSKQVDHINDDSKSTGRPTQSLKDAVQPPKESILPPEGHKHPDEPKEPPNEPPNEPQTSEEPSQDRIWDHADSLNSSDIPNPIAGTHRLVILVPMDSPDPNLCKLIFSAMANGYPSPIIVNWGNEGDRPQGGLDRSHLFKIIKSLEYMDTMMRGTAHPDDRIYDNDLIIILDAIDLWWQLPPEILINRYHEINRQANVRLAKQWGTSGRMPMEQTIVGAAQKRCWPGAKEGINLHCDALPESPERKDMYGEGTDEGKNLRKNRCFTLNSGTVMGPARDMRRFLRRAQDRLSRVQVHHPDVRTDQGLLGEVWGEQEMVRSWLREQPNRGEDQYLFHPAMQVMIESFEYFMGLDYAQRIAIATNFKEDDGALVKLDNHSHIGKMSAERGIDPVRLTGVPQDILNIQTPLRKYIPDQETANWGDLTLYADFYAEAVPVILHFNGEKETMKRRRITWWDEMWYFPYLRRLVNKYLEQPVELPLLGEYKFGEQKVVYQALPSELTKRKPRMYAPEMAPEGLPVMEFKDICKAKPGELAWYDEIFRDGLGPL